jgi:chromosome segregation protein
MRIKFLELIGFKSFYEKTAIDFQNGINAIVGPNGCGKSNVLDAIHWVLGEHNPRRLRAEAMGEVVSNGGETLKPLGMAEVSVLFTDVRENGFDELQIKRRLFRSGESEYYINGTLCRLKDITEMFMDTGAGARAYSTIDQGKIDNLITAKPEDRRAIIEEVAGILKYRARRRETERHIESTKENLRRVRDVMDEVNRQMATLSRQANDAEEFRHITEETRHLELEIIRSKLFEAEKKRQNILTDTSRLQNTISSLLETTEKKEAAFESMKSQIFLIDGKLEGLGKEIYETKTELQAKEALEDLRKSEATGVDEFIKRLEKEIQSLKEEDEKIASQLGVKENNLEELNIELRSKETEVIQKEETLSKLKLELTRTQSDIETTRTMLFEALDKYGSLKGAALGYEKELADLKSRRERTKKEIEEVAAEIDKISSRVSELESILVETGQRRTKIDGTKENFSSALSGMSISQELKKKKSALLSENLKEVHSMVNVLRKIEMNYDWLPEGIRKFLLEKRGNGLLGVVADFISVPRGYERALEAALGERLKWILVKESEEALRAVNSLRELSLGRGTFVPVSNLRNNSNVEKNGKDVVPLSEMIKVVGMDKDVMKGILKGVFVVSSLRDALRLSGETEEGASFVTLEGDLLHSGGAISGGFTTEGVFERKREIEDLTLEAENLELELSEILKEIDINQEEIEKLQSMLGAAEKESVEIEIKEAEIKKDISNLRDNLTKIQRRYEIVEFDSKRINSEALGKETELKEAASQVKHFDNEKTLLQEKFGKLNKSIQKLEEGEKSLEREITGLRVGNAALIEKEKGIEKDLYELKMRRDEIKERINLEAQEVEKKKQEKLSLVKTDEDTKKEAQRLLGVLREKEEELFVSKNEKDELLREIKTAQDEKERLREELMELEKKSNSFKFQLSAIQTQAEHLREATRENGLEINQIDPAKTESFSYEGFKGRDREAEEARLRKLKEKIEKFGPVNLLAPEEYKNLEERFKFLSEQNEDLVNALSSLRKAMNRIDRESEERFEETFEIINKKFQEVFSTLFRGGEAKLVLTNNEDLIETGVEIRVKPGGKRFQSVNLLSGGEKALSAIALVLSACFIKPAPFLLFDEIDAPLDDANTGQFTDLLKDVAEESQIVIITHNKKTMQAANSLIGITSDKRSISKVVSVELTQV